MICTDKRFKVDFEAHYLEKAQMLVENEDYSVQSYIQTQNTAARAWTDFASYILLMWCEVLFWIYSYAIIFILFLYCLYY